MPRLTYRAHALGPLRAIDWTIPPGVSVIVGPNRVGKSTLLRLPELIRMAHEGNIAEAIAKVFGGSASLRNLTMPASAPLSIGLAYEDDAWSMDLPLRGGALAPYEAETLSHKGQILARRPFGSPVAHVGDLPLRLGQEHLLFVGAEFTATTMASMSVNEEWSLESYKRHLAESPPLGVDVQIANALAHCTGLVWISKRARS
ncbi:MAG: hypothetical protein H6710_10300, partial [Myxococcales bacterium]|nr:hypothetical protein [Myxococcales bacterium]